MHQTSKIITAKKSLLKIVADLRKQGKTIVLTQGSFDLVHIGHARYCTEAKKYGDVLIVGVDSDVKVRQRKGEDRPVVPQEERLEMLTYLGAVDYVFLKELDEPQYFLINLIKPDVLIATKQTYTAKKIEELEKMCGKVVVLQPMATTSTSAKLRRLQIGMAEKIAQNLTIRLTDKLREALTDVLSELKK